MSSRPRRGVALVAPRAVRLVVPAPAEAAAAARASRSPVFHRLDPDHTYPAPGHEQLSCLTLASVEGASVGAPWSCAYDKVPELALGFFWDAIHGTFRGHEIDPAGWSCPDW